MAIPIKYSKILFKLTNYRSLNTCSKTKNTIKIGNHEYETDSWTNITPKIQSYLGLNKHLKKNHPLSIVRQRIINYFYKTYKNSRGNPLFSVYDNISPIVSVQQNFDELLIPNNHPSRAKSDCYYINQYVLLRAHLTAHQVSLIKSGLDNFLVVGDVYRRDEIDTNHYPVFHQIDGVRLVSCNQLFDNNPDLNIFETSFKTNKKSFSEDIIGSKLIDQTKQPFHTLEAVKLIEYELKRVLTNLTIDLFGNNIKYRWIDTYFPFTQPSWELEIFHNEKWIEVLGSGIIQNEILQNAGVNNSIGYAFGLGLERLAMILFDIPDIRLFWSNDTGFLSQFNENNLYEKIKYKPISIYPQCIFDLSFWLPDGIKIEEFILNDFYDIVRNIAGDLVEQITIFDQFVHPKTGKCSLSFNIVYRHMGKTLTKAEAYVIHRRIAETCVRTFNVTIR